MAPYGTDELALAGALRGAPVKVVKAETVDFYRRRRKLLSRAWCCRTFARRRARSVKYPAITRPTEAVIEVTAITHRKNPIYLKRRLPDDGESYSKQLPLEATYYWQLKKEFPGVTAVHFPAAGTVGMTCVIAMKQLRMRGAQFAATTHPAQQDHGGGRRRRSHYRHEKVWWAITTRTQADEDVI